MGLAQGLARTVPYNVHVTVAEVIERSALRMQVDEGARGAGKGPEQGRAPELVRSCTDRTGVASKLETKDDKCSLLLSGISAHGARSTGSTIHESPLVNMLARQDGACQGPET